MLPLSFERLHFGASSNYPLLAWLQNFHTLLTRSCSKEFQRTAHAEGTWIEIYTEKKDSETETDSLSCGLWQMAEGRALKLLSWSGVTY
jgi:hypothetical protein